MSGFDWVWLVGSLIGLGMVGLGAALAAGLGQEPQHSAGPRRRTAEVILAEWGASGRSADIGSMVLAEERALELAAMFDDLPVPPTRGLVGGAESGACTGTEPLLELPGPLDDWDAAALAELHGAGPAGTRLADTADVMDARLLASVAGLLQEQDREVAAWLSRWRADLDAWWAREFGGRAA